MIIIPELETVLLQPPRTGTTSLRDAVLEKYPQAFLLYRHMEADGIPFGYSHWRKVCQVRDPLERLKSLYFYMRKPQIKARTCPHWVRAVQEASSVSFVEWLESPVAFTSPGIPGINLCPRDSIMWHGPDQKKSQYLWGKSADVFLFNENLSKDAMDILGVAVGHVNKAKDKTPIGDAPTLHNFLWEYHAWDLSLYRQEGYYDA